MKLDYRKTIYIGLIFLVISMFWQTYDMLIARILIDKFGLNQFWSGIVMALDNMLAVFLLPLFGSLSDKSKHKRGRRTPFIVIGTILAAFAFMALSYADALQTERIKSTDLIESHYDPAFSGDQNDPQHWQIVIDVMIDERTESFQSGLISQQQYADWQTRIQVNMQNIVNQSESQLSTRDLSLLKDHYYNYLSSLAWDVTSANLPIFIVFILTLLVALVAMSIFRSPAVALMPDITIKPLRSKANAIINLMGAAGGILAINIIMFHGLNSHTYSANATIFVAVGVLMILALAVFLWKVNEPKYVLEKELEEQKYQIDHVKENQISVDKLPKDKLRSLIFLLITVFLLFFGYNAVTTKIADYLPKVLNMDFYAFPFILAQAFVILTIYPIGLLSMKLGRKKSVLIGILILTAAMSVVVLLNENLIWVVAVIIMLAGIGWSLIGINSYPMVVELSAGSDVGKYTGYYYSASMLAQMITPIVSGHLMDQPEFGRLILFPYGAFFIGMSFFTMLLVKHGDSKKPSFFKRRVKHT